MVKTDKGQINPPVKDVMKEEVELDEAKQKPYVSSDRDGKHVMNASGEIVKSFKDMDSASAYLKKNYNKLMKEKLDKEDEPTVKAVVKMLKKASNAHAGQAKDLEKAVKEDSEPINEGYGLALRAAPYIAKAAPYIAKAIKGTAKTIAKNPGKSTIAGVAAANPDVTKKVVGGAAKAAKTIAKNTGTIAKAAKIGAGAAAAGAAAYGAKKAYDAAKKKDKPEVKKEDTQFDEIAIAAPLATGALGALGAYGMNKMLGNPNKKKQKEKTESAASDARRAMASDPSTKQKFSKNVSATDDDVKAADKNIIMQMRKAVSLRGNKVEFMDKKKVMIPQKIAQAVIAKYNNMKKPADKEKFQSKISKSYKSMLATLKEQNEINNKNNSLDQLKELVKEMKGKNNG